MLGLASPAPWICGAAAAVAALETPAGLHVMATAGRPAGAAWCSSMPEALQSAYRDLCNRGTIPSGCSH